MVTRHPAFALYLRGILFLLLVAAALVSPAVAAAATKKSTFHRFEVIGDSRFIETEPCPEGSVRDTSRTTVAITAGHEDESQDGTPTVDNDYLRFGIQTFECDGTVTTDRAFSQPGDDVTFSYTPSLSTASVTGTLTTSAGVPVSVDVTWTGLGTRAETTRNKTKFPGFSGTFVGKTRDATAQGTVVYAGETVVTGSATFADLESLEDTNVTTSG